jgi:hypothetical protein
VCQERFMIGMKLTRQHLEGCIGKANRYNDRKICGKHHMQVKMEYYYSTYMYVGKLMEEKLKLSRL